MAYLLLFYFILFKLVISDRDVTTETRATHVNSRSSQLN